MQIIQMAGIQKAAHTATFIQIFNNVVIIHVHSPLIKLRSMNISTIHTISI